MTTTIIGNGSKWAGEAPDPLPVLLERLATDALDPTFEAYGNFFYRDPYDAPHVTFFGNFHRVSHVFQIHTDELEMIYPLVRAIRMNQATPAYAAAKAALAKRTKEGK